MDDPITDSDRRHWGGRVERLVCHLRFDLAARGHTVEALALLRRLLAHPRLARAVCTHPITGRLPWVLVRSRSGVSDQELLDAIGLLQSRMPTYGQAQCEYALHLLGDSGAISRIRVLLAPQAGREPAVAVTNVHSR